VRIDAHQHFWRIDRGDYGWLTPALGPIWRDFLPDDLAPLLHKTGVEATVLVQAAPTPAETAFLLDLAESTPFVAGVVGWVDLEARGATEAIARLAGRPKLVGLRPMIQDLADDAWMLRETLEPAIEAMIAHDLTFDALVTPRHLPILRAFALRHPDLRIVIDHGAKPDIAAGALEPWAGEMRAIARDTRLYCKLSGLVTQAAHGASDSDLSPFVDTLLEAFGPERLMFGSDWPVLARNCAYSTWFASATRALCGRGMDDHRWVFGATAAAFYGLDP
jgi:L-fuconolactonase